MAQKVAAATGAWSAAATWNSVTNTPTLHATTNITISTSNLFTATFTAPNLVNACTGVLVFINAVGSGGTVTVTLQESTVDTAATRSIAVTSLTALTFVYFRFATPYVFAAAGAGAYRFKIVNAGAAGTTTAAADSGAANIAYLATDDRTGVPGATDDVWIPGQNQATAIAVTMDGTQTIGSGTNTTGITQRSIGSAVMLSNSGSLIWDTAASATLTSKGTVVIQAGGELQIGTVATPYPAAFIGSLIFNENGIAVQYGLEMYGTGKATLQGQPKTSTSLWKTTYVSGAGTAASPMIVTDAVDWAVNDEIIVCAYSANATNYNESENKFILTKNSPTSYVISNTAGGAEAALAFTHTAGAYIVNVTRNVIVKSSTATEGFYVYNTATVAGNDWDWVRFETMGAGTNNKLGIGLALTNTTTTVACDYCVAYRPIRNGFYTDIASAILTFTGLIVCNSTSASTAGIRLAARSNNKTLTDCFALKNFVNGIEVNATSNVTLNTCVAISNNLAATAGYGYSLVSASAITLNSCEYHCNRLTGLLLSTAVVVTTNSLLAGTKGTNAIDVVCASDTFNDALFLNSSFGSATLVSNYLNMILGSEVRFHKANGTENNHFWYTNTGIARNSGAGLADTTTKTVGSFALRLAPENLTTGLVWESLIGISANSAASVFGFIQKNVAFGTSVVTVELFLPGSTVADATQTMGDTTGTWLVFSMAAAYNGSVAAFARVRITAKTATASAYVYVADLYNGTNVLTSFKAWNDGKPSPVFTDLLGDPASVWAILESTQTTVGTMGYEISTDLATLRADVDDLQTRVPAALTAGGNIKADTLMIEGVDATNQIRDSILTDATRFAGANIDATISSRLASASYTAPPSAASVVSTLLATLIETGLTFKNAMRLMAASAAAKLSGAATAQVTIRNAVADDKDRIIADVDANGNRTNVTYDLSD